MSARDELATRLAAEHIRAIQAEADLAVIQSERDRLAQQLALVRASLAAALDELAAERAARLAAETERDRLRSALATMMAQADAEAGRHEGAIAAYRMLLRDAERAAGQSGDVDHGAGGPTH